MGSCAPKRRALARRIRHVQAALERRARLLLRQRRRRRSRRRCRVLHPCRRRACAASSPRRRLAQRRHHCHVSTACHVTTRLRRRAALAERQRPNGARAALAAGAALPARAQPRIPAVQLHCARGANIGNNTPRQRVAPPRATTPGLGRTQHTQQGRARICCGISTPLSERRGLRPCCAWNARSNA